MSRSHDVDSSMGNSSSRLNPNAREFRHTTRISSKRKASSSATSGQSIATATRAESAQGPISIDSAQILEDRPSSNGSPGGVRNDRSEGWDDLDELEDAIFARTMQQIGLAAGPQAFGSELHRRRQRNDPLQSSSSRRSTAASDNARNPAVLLMKSLDAHDGGSASAVYQPMEQVRYLPLHQRMNNDLSQYVVLPSHAHRIQRAAAQAPKSKRVFTWPGDRVPVEIFELVTSYLARDDVKSLRLVSKEFERKVCQSLFRTSVVPFNTELYDMIIDETKTDACSSQTGCSTKEKMKATNEEADSWTWLNAKQDKEGKVYKGHGLRVFQGFGPYIKRFGMSFEVSESQLSLPPGKQLLDPIESYHGTYEWPPIDYARFVKLNRLEDTADETSRMKAAFSNLAIATELGLSVRNGLGWLDGPDKSFRTIMLQQGPTMFGSSSVWTDRRTKAANKVQSDLRQCVQRATPSASFKELVLEHHAIDRPLDKIVGLSGTCLANTQLWSRFEHGVLGSSLLAPTSGSMSVLVANHEMKAATNVHNHHLSPNELKREQKEWLLETEWAQRAFLESYILAVMDNPAVFSRTTTLRITTVSSGLLPMVSRAMFWDALPSLTSAAMHVSADWRIVQKDEAANAETKLQNPSDAVRSFLDLLRDHISWRDTITRLEIGWADGGEHAQGMYARNANLLPAPISQLDHSTSLRPTSQLMFPYVEHLTLINCWIAPPVLENLVRNHSSHTLKKLTLDSVSLTAYPHPSTQAQQAYAQAMAVVQQNHQTVLNAQAQGGQAQQGLAPHQLTHAAQQFHQQMQQMQQLFNNNAAAPNQNAFPLPAFGALPPGNAAAGQVAGFPNIPAGQNVHGQGGWPFQPLPVPPQQAANTPSLGQWMDGHRQGSWPHLLDRISPGAIFTDYLPLPQPWEQPRPPRRTTHLQSIELVSCGYARLEQNSTFDQVPLLDGPRGVGERIMTPWFRARALALKPYMLDASRDKYLGSIVQWIPQRELDAMRDAWGLRAGWQDEEKAEEAEFDGFLPGGTGRVSGVIEQGMPLVGHQLGDADRTEPMIAMAA